MGRSRSAGAPGLAMLQIMGADVSDNPLLHRAFRIPFDRIDASHVGPAIDELIARGRARLDAVAAQSGARTWANTMLALERATEDLEWASTIVGHLESVATTPELRAAYNEAQPKIGAFYASIPLDPGLWRALVAYADTDEAHELDGMRRRLLEKTLDDFRRHGAELPEGDKQRLAAIDTELSVITSTFAQNVLDATNDWSLVIDDEAQLAGLPESAKDAARANAQSKGLDGWRFTLQAPSVIPMLTYLDDAGLREQVWRAYNGRASAGERNNVPVLRQILKLRAEKAKLLGYADFADLVLEDRMAHTGRRAREFVADLESRSRSFFDRETKELSAFRRELEGADAPALQPWDVGYYAEKLRQARYDFDEEQLRPYFPAPRVLAGMFETVERLYGITVEPVEDLPTWHSSVETYALTDEHGRRLGLFYADMYPREDKRGGAWMHGLLNAEPGREGFDEHLGLIAGNISEPVGDRPALLTHREVETLFHEFGHLLHHMLTEVPIRSLAGTRVAWDFVELPSQIMENWCWEREALDLIARHWQTDETIPPALFDKMTAARTFRAATGMMRQLGFASLDLALHTDFDPNGDDDVLAYVREIQQRFATTALPTEYAMVCGFTHLFASPVGYAAGYYSYKWAEVLDADAFSRFEEAGVFDRQVGDRFRREILAKGDSDDPDRLYENFMGRKPQLEALLRRSGLVEAA